MIEDMPEAELPLSALLSQAFVAYTIEFDNEFEHRIPHRSARFGGTRQDGPWLTSMAMWWTCLRYVDADGIQVGELAARTGLTTNLPGMVRWGYVTLDPAPRGTATLPRRDTVVRPTGWGERARAIWAPLSAEVDARWTARNGDALRTALVGAVSSSGVDLPDCLPILGYGLFCGGAAQVSERDPDPATVAALPLPALLARALLSIALPYEKRSPRASLASSANLLRVLDTSPIPVRDIPELAGVSKEGLSMAAGALTKQGLVCVDALPKPRRGKQIRLTTAGLGAKASYEPLLAEIESRLPGAAELRAALQPLTYEEALTPYPDNWRATVRTRSAALPHFPMVLHRGGYPDGA